MTSERYPLRQIIVEDLIRHNKVALILFILIAATALATVSITAKTRELEKQKHQLLQENRKLEIQYVHLQLEEVSSGHFSRVEAVAQKLGLQPIQKNQEVIVEK